MGISRSDDETIRDIVAETLAEHPVSVGFLFGSRARGEAHSRSDIDVAVAFEEELSSRLESQLALGADLAIALGTDDVDVVDLRTAPSSLVNAVFRDGDRLIGTEADERQLKATLRGRKHTDPRSRSERFDDALAAIEDHLA